MSARPQYSLRTVPFVMAMICLAAATMAPLRPPPRPAPPMFNGGGGGGMWVWEEFGFAIHAQAWLRIAACVVFPAVFMAAAVARRGYTRTFCLGAILPASVPPVLLALDFSVSNSIELVLESGAIADGFIGLGEESYALAERITTLLVCIPCIGLACVLARRFLRMPRHWDGVAQRRVSVRILVVALLAVFASAAMIALPSSNNPFGAQPSGVRQIPVRTALCLMFPALLAVGALQGRGMVRAFCGCGLLPAVMPVMLVSGLEFIGGQALGGRWEPGLVFPTRYAIALMWALIPVFGLTAALVYWLLRTVEADGSRSAPET